MRSYRLEGTGGIESLVLRDEARPEPGAHEIVVRIRATSLNRRDTMILN
ncbi:NAD(P)-dependent alcohol dehydrogenase, partial [Mesorhizobium sp. M7A.F.Ca.CA.003.01.2.1]